MTFGPCVCGDLVCMHVCVYLYIENGPHARGDKLKAEKSKKQGTSARHSQIRTRSQFFQIPESKLSHTNFFWVTLLSSTPHDLDDDDLL